MGVHLNRLAGLMIGAVADGVFPGGVLRIEREGYDALTLPVGRLTYEPDGPAVTPDTIYDLASLTKVIATTSLVMQAVERGELDVEWTLARALDRDDAPWLADVTVADLLAHRSGLPDWRPFFRMLEEAGIAPGAAEARGFVVDRIVEEGLVDPPGTAARYSDLGFLLLGAVLERALGAELRVAYQADVLERYWLGSLDYRPVGEAAAVPDDLAPTEDCAWRGRVLRGEVHDENCAALGGVAPHAGLFGRAGEVGRFGMAMLQLWREDAPGIRAFTTRHGVPDGSTWALGWDTPTEGASSAGPTVGPRAFGHLGYAGTSLWIDPDRETVVVLLTNRVHPTRDNTKIRTFRPAIHEIAWAWADALG